MTHDESHLIEAKKAVKRITELEAERDRLKDKVHAALGALDTATYKLKEALNRADACRHEWYEAGEKCEKCGRAKTMVVNSPQETDNG